MKTDTVVGFLCLAFLISVTKAGWINESQLELMYDQAQDLYKNSLYFWDMSSGYSDMLGNVGMKICFVEGPELEALVLGEKSNISTSGSIELQEPTETSVMLPQADFTVALWYSFRPVDFFAEVNDTMSCDLLKFGGGSGSDDLAISYSGPKEYNLKYKYGTSVIDDNQERPNWEFDVNCTYTGLVEKRGWQWNHIAVVYDGNKLAAYYNGFKVNVTATSAGGNVVSVNGLHLNLPITEETPGCGPVGFDEVSVWNEALSEGEILALRVYVGRNRSEDELELTTFAETTTELPTTTVAESTAGETTAGDTTAGDTTAGDTTAGDTTAGESTSTAGPLPTTVKPTTAGGASTEGITEPRPSSSPESTLTDSVVGASTNKASTGGPGPESTQPPAPSSSSSLASSSSHMTSAPLSQAEKTVQDQLESLKENTNRTLLEVTTALNTVQNTIADELLTDGIVDKVLDVLEVTSTVPPATEESSQDDIDDLQDFRKAFVDLYSTTVGKMNSEATTATDGNKLMDVLDTFLGAYVDDPTVANNETLSSTNIDVKMISVDGSLVQMSYNTSIDIPSGAIPGDAKVVVCIIPEGPLQDVVEPKGDQQPKNHAVVYSTKPTWNITSPIVVLKLAGQSGSVKLNEPVRFKVPVNKILGESPLCVFEDNGTWNEDGLKVIDYDEEIAIVECQTTHMTNFAVLMAVDGVPLEGAHAAALSIISYIGCGLSLFCLLIAIILFIVLRELNSTRMGIVKNLCVALFLAQLLFVTGIQTAAVNEIACKAVAAMLHYLFLCVIAWMFCNGIYLYQKVHSAARPGSVVDLIYFAILGWGAPAVVVAITAGVDHKVYGTKDLCWLSVEGSGIWAFVIPAMLIILFNAFVTFLTMKAFMSVKVFKDKTDKDKFKSGLRAIVVMLPILGLSWVFGLLAFGETGIFFQYLFAIFNSLQGVFLFIFHIFLNDEVKSAMRRRFGKVGASGDENTLFNKIWAFGGNNSNAEKTQMSSVTQTEMLSSAKPVYKN